jgi:hypothetical protein
MISGFNRNNHRKNFVRSPEEVCESSEKAVEEIY